jgi:hypothetical protein
MTFDVSQLYPLTSDFDLRVPAPKEYQGAIAIVPD